MDTSMKEPVISKPTTTIFVCTMIIRAVTIGYVVGGFVIKFHLNYLDTEIVYILDHMTLDILPLGSTLMFLIYSLMPLLLLYTIVGGVSFILLVRRTRTLLITHAVGNGVLILLQATYLCLFLWIVIETSYDSTLKNDFDVVHSSRASVLTIHEDHLKWQIFFQTLKCCNVTGEPTINERIGGFYGYSCQFTSGCLDVVCVGITEYFFRVAELKKRNDLTHTELLKCSNGMLGEFHKMSVAVWKSNKTQWISVFVKIFDFTYEFSLGCSILILTYSWFVDHYLKSALHTVSKDGIFMGYLENILLITFLCVILVSMSSKLLHFTALYKKGRILLVVDIITNFFLLLVELIVFTFATFLVRMLYCCISGNEGYYCHFSNTDKFKEICSNGEGIWSRAIRNVWLALAFLLFHITLKVAQLIMADRIFRTVQTGQEKETVGFLRFLFLKTKRKPLVAANIALGIFTMVYSCVFFCGLLVVRYDQNAYEKVTSTLHGISSNETDVNMGDLRDSSYIIMAVTLVYSFLIQIVLFIGIYYEKTHLLIGFFGAQIFFTLPQATSWILITFPLRVIYCCIEGIDHCKIFSDKDDIKILCSGESDLWISTSTEIWLFWSFTLGSLIIQVLSLVLCVKLHDRLFPEMRLYMRCTQFGKSLIVLWKHVITLWKHLFSWISNNPNMFITILILSTLVIEIGFGIAIYVYYFNYVDTSTLQNFLGNYFYSVFNMRYLMNGLAYTLTASIPMSAILRPSLLWMLYFKKKIQFAHIFIMSYLTFVVGELIMLILSALLINFGYPCQEAKEYQHYAFIFLYHIWQELCSSYKETIHNMEAINITFLGLHLILNIIFIILVDRRYPILQNDKENKGVFRSWWNKLKSQFVDGKVQRFFKVVQWFNAIVEITYGIVIYNLYFRNFYPFDAHVQQDLGVLGKHRYDMQDLLNAVSYTFMALIPLTLGFRLVFLLAGLFQRQFFIFIIIITFFTLSGGHLVLLTHSSYLLNLAYSCLERHSSHYTSASFSLFCDTNVQFVFDIAGVFISYLIIQLVLNGLSMVILNRLYMYDGKSPTTKGAFSTVCKKLLSDIKWKNSKLRITFLVVFTLMLIIRVLFWVGLVLMGLTPGYIHTDLIDKMYSMHIGDMNYGRTSLGLLYSHLVIVPLDIACHCLEIVSVTRMSKLFLFIGVLFRVISIASDIAILVLSSLVLNLAYCLCGPGPTCYSPFTEQKETVCRNSYLLFHVSGVMVAYVVVNFCSHIFEIAVCMIWSKKTNPTPKIYPTVNGAPNQLNDVEISEYEDIE
ncbi:uncharacterized protein LOC111121673 isoform X2 [Crassostrea virginica]